MLRNGEVPTALTLLLFWLWSTSSFVFPGQSARTSYSFVLPHPTPHPPTAPTPSPTPVPDPNKPYRFCGRKATSLLTLHPQMYIQWSLCIRCTSGGVHVPCTYSHARRELPWAIQVFQYCCVQVPLQLVLLFSRYQLRDAEDACSCWLC